MPNLSEPSIKVKEFAGLNNKAEPRAMQPGELVRADNVDIDDRNRMRRRRGYQQSIAAASEITAAWNTPDETRMFIIDGGDLKEYVELGVTRTLASGFAETEAYFADAGDRYFVSCGGRLGFIYEDTYQDLLIPTPETPLIGVLDGDLYQGRRLVATVLETADGRQGGASAIQAVTVGESQGLTVLAQDEPGYTTRIYVSGPNGDQLRYAGSISAGGQILITDDSQLSGDVLDGAQVNASSPPTPDGPIVYINGRLLITAADRSAGVTYLFRSLPFWPHLFTPWMDAETVHGTVLMLAESGGAVVVGTDRGIFASSDEGGLAQLVDYGVVPGPTPLRPRTGSAVYFWTHEGLCRALPFENLTDARVSAPPGDRAHVGLVSEGGFDRIVVGTQVGSENKASNPR